MNRPSGGRGHATSKKPILQLRTDSDFVVLKGGPQEAGPGEIAGSLVLMNSDLLKQVQKITITLEGVRKVSWFNNAINPQMIKQKERFFRREMQLDVTEGGCNKPHQLPVGNHQWPFRFEIPGDTPESIEGLDSSYIIYNLHATVDRNVLFKDLRTSKHIRILRTPGFEELEGALYPNPMEGIWANKFRYKITMPKSNYAYGTSLTTHFDLTPVKKGVTMKSVKLELYEGIALSMHDPMRTHDERDWCIQRKEMDVPEGTEYLVPEVDPEDPVDEGHRFSVSMDLPKSLRKCRQSCNTEFIRIKHWVQVYVNVTNPEGHVSQINKDMKVNLQISPRFAIGDDQVVDTSSREQQAADDTDLTAPPTYEDREFDQLYSEIDPSGFMTPAPIAATSGAGTPHGLPRSNSATSRHSPSSHSRSESTENLAAGFGFSADPNHGGVSARQLRSTLANLQARDHGTSATDVTGGNASNRVSATQTPMHLQGSNDSYFPEHGNAFDLEHLSRVPSYGTAMRSATRTPARTPLVEGLPSYEAATSRPGSPSPPRDFTPRSSGSGSSASSDSGSVLTGDEAARNTMLNAIGRRLHRGRHHTPPSEPMTEPAARPDPIERRSSP